MKKIHCDNECGTSIHASFDEWDTFKGDARNWIKAQRGNGMGNPHRNGPWHLCSLKCAEQFFAREELKG